MNKDQIIARVENRFPDADPAAVRDYANDMTESGTEPAPADYVDIGARSLFGEDHDPLRFERWNAIPYLDWLK